MASHKGKIEHVTREEELTLSLLELIRSLLSETAPEGARLPRVLPDSSLGRDLGLDSLTRVELLSRIERRFGVTLADTAFSDAETPRDLVREISKANAFKLAPTAEVPSTLPLRQVSDTPADAQTLVDVLEWHVHTHPEQAHIQFYTDQGDGEFITYQQLHRQSRTLAANLQHLGIQPGDPVAIMLPTGPEYFFTFFGILLAGGIPVPIYPPSSPSQLEDHLRRHAAILDNCRAVTLITVVEAKRLALLLKSLVETLQHIVAVEDLLNPGNELSRPGISPQDTAFLQYTSGSTGNPKGVVLSHANLLTNIRAMGERVRASSDDVFVSWLPLYHDMGLIGAWLGSLYFGALYVVMSPLAFLSRPLRWFQAIHRYRGTLSAAPNFGYELCLSRIEDNDLNGLDLSSWRAAFNGAEAVSPDTIMQFTERFRKCGFRATAMMPVYGLAECSVGLAFPPLNQGVRIDAVQRKPFMQSGVALPADESDTHALRFVACGRPLVGHEIRIATPQGDELPECREGRLQFRGPSTTSGYLRNPEANKRLFDGDWLDSGDRGYLSEGDLFVTGRTKDIIIRAGRNLYPHELEAAVGKLEGIRKGRVAVFGVPNPRTGTERLVILAETREQGEAALENLRQRVNATAVELIGDPPDEVVLAPPRTVLKTSSGKIRRSACRAIYESGFVDKQQAPVWRQVSRLLIASISPQLRRIRHSLASGLWSGYAQALFWTLAPLTWLLVILSPSRDHRWKIMRWATRFLARLTGIPFRVDGLEQLPSGQQACIFVANHGSYLDGPLLIAALNRPFSFVAKAELEHQFFAGTFLRRIQTEFVRRGDPRKGVEDFQHIASLAQTDRSLCFFPEGTFTRVPGVLPFHLGAFLTAVRTGLPVVPVAIRGSRSILRGEAKRPQPGAVTITIGKAIIPETSTEDDWSSAIALRDAARAFILNHCGEPDLGGEVNLLREDAVGQE